MLIIASEILVTISSGTTVNINPAVSPDGVKLAYIGNCDIWTVNVAAAAIPVLLWTEMYLISGLRPGLRMATSWLFALNPVLPVRKSIPWRPARAPLKTL